MSAKLLAESNVFPRPLATYASGNGFEEGDAGVSFRHHVATQCLVALVGRLDGPVVGNDDARGLAETATRLADALIRHLAGGK
jgi:hypothetical protein